MKHIITTIFALSYLITFGQNTVLDNLWKLYDSRDYEKVIITAQPYLETDSLKLDLQSLLGRTYCDKGDFNTAIPYLDYTIKNDKHNVPWRKAWALNYLGTCYFILHDYEKSEAYLNECIKVNATKNATKNAYGKTLLFGFNEFFKTWTTIETENFIFHFQDMTDKEIKEYVSIREHVFNEINNFFESDVPKKIDFFVWNSREDAKKLLGKNLGFTRSDFCVIHTHFQQTKGHEMTHVISNYTTNIRKTTGLINEGTAVCFNQTNHDKQLIVKDWLVTHDKKITISKIWTNWKDYPEKLSYPLSGLFVRELIDNFGREKFIKFFENQTYDNAKKVFGDKLDKVIKEFEDKMNT